MIPSSFHLIFAVVTGMIAIALVIVLLIHWKLTFWKRSPLKASRDICPYIKRPLLTNHELDFYRELRPVADALHLHVLSKIRVADLVEVQDGLSKSDWGKYFSKIRAKHVDFVLCDPDTLTPKLIIELDDRSHQQPDRIARDQFIDAVFANSGYRILHVYSADDLRQRIRRALS